MYTYIYIYINTHTYTYQSLTYIQLYYITTNYINLCGPSPHPWFPRKDRSTPQLPDTFAQKTL